MCRAAAAPAVTHSQCCSCSTHKTLSSCVTQAHAWHMQLPGHLGNSSAVQQRSLLARPHASMYCTRCLTGARCHTDRPVWQHCAALSSTPRLHRRVDLRLHYAHTADMAGSSLEAAALHSVIYPLRHVAATPGSPHMCVTARTAPVTVLRGTVLCCSAGDDIVSGPGAVSTPLHSRGACQRAVCARCQLSVRRPSCRPGTRPGTLKGWALPAVRYIRCGCRTSTGTGRSTCFEHSAAAHKACCYCCVSTRQQPTTHAGQ